MNGAQLTWKLNLPIKVEPIINLEFLNKAKNSFVGIFRVPKLKSKATNQRGF